MLSAFKTYNDHKLAFRNKKCFFLGYSNYQKGYMCLDLATNRVYISRHVVFDEHSFPAKELVVFNSHLNQNSTASKSLIIPTSVMSSSLLSPPNFTDIQSQPLTSDPTSLSPILHIPDISPPSNLEHIPDPQEFPDQPHIVPSISAAPLSLVTLVDCPDTQPDQPVITTIQTCSKTGHS
jgi:histone deacetylase 1/2